jgi:tetratricopeptide (TPR) repeat protein
MIFRLHLLSVFLAVGTIISGCKTGEGKSTPAKDDLSAEQISEGNASEKASLTRVSRKRSETKMHADEEEYRRRVEAFARFSTGVSHELNDNTAEALEEFYKSALSDPGNHSLVSETARRLLQADQTDRAIEILSRAAQDTDATTPIYTLLGRAYFQSGKTNEAITANQVAIRKSPQSIVGYQNLAEIYYQMGKFPEALKVLENAGKESKADANFFIALAETYAKYIPLQPKSADILKPRGLDALNRAVALKPQNPSLLQKLADTMSTLGERGKAAELYAELLEKYSEAPGMRDVLREKLANIYLLGNEKQRAAELLQAIVRDNPTRYPQAYYVLGTICFDQKKYAEASEHFRKAILIVPDLEQAYYDLAASFINNNRAAEAKETLEKAAKKFPKSFTGEFYAGLAAQRLKDYAAAVKHFTAAEVIAGATDSKRLDHLFYFQIGACYERNKEYEQAAKYFEKSLELKPDEAETLNYLGYMWAEQGTNLVKARELIEKALKLEPENAAYLDSLGWVLFKLNQHEAALAKLLEAAEKMKDPDPVLFDHLGDVYSALKNPAKAREYWEKSIAVEPSDEVKKKLSLSL